MSIFTKLFHRKLHSFTPDYVVKPSETIKEAIESKGALADYLFEHSKLTYRSIVCILADEYQIDEFDATELSIALGCTPEFWMALSKNYFEKRGEK